MYLKNNYLSSSFIFVFLFVFQQIIEYTYVSYSLVSVYWLFITISILSIGIYLPFMSIRYRYPLIFTIVTVLGAFSTILNGTNIGIVLIKSFSILFGFIGFVYLSEKKINLYFFDWALVIMYTFFYLSYFVHDEQTRIFLDDDLFDHSSSNTIAISVVITLFFYLMLNQEVRNANISIKIILFSIINLTLVIIQGSRAGIIASSLLFLLSIIDLFYLKFKSINITTLYLVGLIMLLRYFYLDSIQFFLEFKDMTGLSSYERDVRSYAQTTFFSRMDLNTFIFGYAPNYDFDFYTTRTFNAFLDFWNRFGLFPFALLIIFFFRRLFLAKDFALPLIYLIPLFFYSMVETLWGGTLWDVLIYLSLFYSYKK
jgi:hypothetical protein